MATKYDWPILPGAHPKPNEAEFEERAERYMNHADRVYLSGKCTTEDYEIRCAQIKEWTKCYYSGTLYPADVKGTPLTILERDIQFYEGMVEEAKRRLRFCFPIEEPKIEKEIKTLEAVLTGLVGLREIYQTR